MSDARVDIDKEQSNTAPNQALEQYARATNTQILQAQSDIDTKDRVMEEMLHWCKEQKGLVVLKSSTILSVDPTSRIVQNCKSVLLGKGIQPGHVFPASESLIGVLLASGEKSEQDRQSVGETKTSFSDQQQHLRELVYEAVVQSVSDIHIEVRKGYSKVRMRQHGELRLFAEWSENLGREIASVAFNKETDHATSHFNPLIPQDASMPLKIYGKHIRLRLASVPAHGGFDMVMRILATGDENTSTLEDLGYSAKQVAIIKNAAKLPHGAIIVAGPTGSGKTTTLASCMEMVDPTQKLYSIEDPVEKVVEHATQVPVNTEKEDRDFASMGKAALRMDPDIIILGEMRDEETARVMIRASITGHLVLTTLHTNRAPAIITRLVDMGISPTLLSDSSVLRCLVCQRLVPKLCQSCCKPITQSDAHQPHMNRWREIFGDLTDSLKVRGDGCSECGKKGIGGRTVIAEVIWVDEEGRHYIQKCDTIGWEKYLKSQGWENHNDRAIALVKEGICDPFDAEHVVGQISSTKTSENFDYRQVDR